MDGSDLLLDDLLAELEVVTPGQGNSSLGLPPLGDDFQLDDLLADALPSSLGEGGGGGGHGTPSDGLQFELDSMLNDIVADHAGGVDSSPSVDDLALELSGLAPPGSLGGDDFDELSRLAPPGALPPMKESALDALMDDLVLETQHGFSMDTPEELAALQQELGSSSSVQHDPAAPIPSSGTSLDTPDDIASIREDIANIQDPDGMLASLERELGLMVSQTTSNADLSDATLLELEDLLPPLASSESYALPGVEDLDGLLAETFGESTPILLEEVIAPPAVVVDPDLADLEADMQLMGGQSSPSSTMMTMMDDGAPPDDDMGALEADLGLLAGGGTRPSGPPARAHQGRQPLQLKGASTLRERQLADQVIVRVLRLVRGPAGAHGKDVVAESSLDELIKLFDNVIKETSKVVEKGAKARQARTRRRKSFSAGRDHEADDEVVGAPSGGGGGGGKLSQAGLGNFLDALDPVVQQRKVDEASRQADAQAAEEAEVAGLLGNLDDAIEQNWEGGADMRLAEEARKAAANQAAAKERAKREKEEWRRKAFEEMRRRDEAHKRELEAQAASSDALDALPKVRRVAREDRDPPPSASSAPSGGSPASVGGPVDHEAEEKVELKASELVKVAATVWSRATYTIHEEGLQEYVKATIAEAMDHTKPAAGLDEARQTMIVNATKTFVQRTQQFLNSMKLLNINAKTHGKGTSAAAARTIAQQTKDNRTAMVDEYTKLMRMMYVKNYQPPPEPSASSSSSSSSEPSSAAPRDSPVERAQNDILRCLQSFYNDTAVPRGRAYVHSPWKPAKSLKEYAKDATDQFKLVIACVNGEPGALEVDRVAREVVKELDSLVPVVKYVRLEPVPGTAELSAQTKELVNRAIRIIRASDALSNGSGSAQDAQEAKNNMIAAIKTILMTLRAILSM